MPNNPGTRSDNQGAKDGEKVANDVRKEGAGKTDQASEENLKNTNQTTQRPTQPADSRKA